MTDDGEYYPTTIFVGDLTDEVSLPELENAFTRFGEIDSVRPVAGKKYFTIHNLHNFIFIFFVFFLFHFFHIIIIIIVNVNGMVVSSSSNSRTGKLH